MNPFKAIMFDLDDTLLDRRKAIEAMFNVITSEFYLGKATLEMKQKFFEYDNNGYSNKAEVLNKLFDEYPPNYRIVSDEIYNFWDESFPDCLSIDDENFAVIEKIAAKMKTAIITNGRIKGQNDKIIKTGLNKIFDTIVISEEAGAWKPDPKIFEIALKKLGVKPEETLYVGDHIVKDIGGCQQAGIKGVWCNPLNLKNDTEIVPFKEISDLKQILTLV